VSLESSQQGGVHGVGSYDVWTCNAKVLEYWMISSLKSKLTVAENFGGIGMCLWWLEAGCTCIVYKMTSY